MKDSSAKLAADYDAFLDSLGIGRCAETHSREVHSHLSPDQPWLPFFIVPRVLATDVLPAKVAASRIPDLESWLRALGLSRHLEQILLWCDKMGAVHTEELEENRQELADDLNLSQSERMVLAKA